jgi:RNA polymerase sigma-70 factor (ECF subfamily)
MNEKDAIAQLKHGDMRGLEILVRKYQLEAVRIAIPITSDLGLAEEVVQEAFLRVYERIEQFDEERPFRAWFLRIVVNDALKMVKRHNRLLPLESEPKSEDFEPDGLIYNGRLKVEQVEFSSGHDDSEVLQQLLQSLTPEHRAVLQLKYYLDMSDDEIAEAIQIPAGTVKSRLHAAKQNFRSLLKRLNVPIFA